MKFNAYPTPLPSLKFSHSLSCATVPSVTAFQLANKVMEPHNTCQTLSLTCNCVYWLETQPKFCRQNRQIKINYFWAVVKVLGASKLRPWPRASQPGAQYLSLRAPGGFTGTGRGPLKLMHMVRSFKPSSNLRNSRSRVTVSLKTLYSFGYTFTQGAHWRYPNSVCHLSFFSFLLMSSLNINLLIFTH